MAQYTMKNLDEKWWRRVKSMAAMRGKSIKTIILDLLRRELREYERGG